MECSCGHPISKGEMSSDVQIGVSLSMACVFLCIEVLILYSQGLSSTSNVLNLIMDICLFSAVELYSIFSGGLLLGYE